jgi:hypothetical protein
MLGDIVFSLAGAVEEQGYVMFVPSTPDRTWKPSNVSDGSCESHQNNAYSIRISLQNLLLGCSLHLLLATGVESRP